MLVVSIDSDRCELHGECVLAAPQVFVIEDDADVATVLVEHPGDELRASVMDAYYGCPVQAIRVADE